MGSSSTCYVSLLKPPGCDPIVVSSACGQIKITYKRNLLLCISSYMYMWRCIYVCCCLVLVCDRVHLLGGQASVSDVNLNIEYKTMLKKNRYWSDGHWAVVGM